MLSENRLIKSKQGRGAIEEDSYWDVDFDQDRNCAQEEKIAELRQKVELHLGDCLTTFCPEFRRPDREVLLRAGLEYRGQWISGVRL